MTKAPFIGWLLSLPFRILFPTMAYEAVKRVWMRPAVFMAVFLVGFLTCFALQAWLAHRAGMLGTLDLTFAPTPQPDGTARIYFFDDWANMFNYVLLVPLYLVAGTGYIISLYSLKDRMGPIDEVNGFSLDDGVKPLWSGLAAIFVFVFLLVVLQAQYAMDVQSSPYLFWFHGDSQGARLNYNGYAYLVINVLLNAFVMLIALLHLELFRWSRVLRNGIRRYDASVDPEQNLFMDNGYRLKEMFAPFTETAVWSKGFAMLLAINIYTWKASGVSGGSADSEGVDDNTWFLRFVTLLFIVIALWIVSLPRYRVQWEIFKLREKKGMHEYYDIRMPWTIGWSAFIDVTLLAFFSVAIFGSSDVLNLFTSVLTPD